MEKPTIAALREAVPISQSYASMILADGDDEKRVRTPPRNLAIRIFRATGWRHPIIADLGEDEMAVLERIDPWTPRPSTQELDAA